MVSSRLICCSSSLVHVFPYAPSPRPPSDAPQVQTRRLLTSSCPSRGTAISFFSPPPFHPTPRILPYRSVSCPAKKGMLLCLSGCPPSPFTSNLSFVTHCQAVTSPINFSYQSLRSPANFSPLSPSFDLTICGVTSVSQHCLFLRMSLILSLL